MDSNELRALADALEPMAKAPRFEDFDVPGFCAWVRACADAKPVGYATANGLRMLRQDDATVLLYAHDYLIRPDHVALYTHPAPAVPAIEERGPWSARQDKQQPWEQRVWIESDDFTHDVRLYVHGDFESSDQRFAYAQEIARRLNAAPAAPHHAMLDSHRRLVEQAIQSAEHPSGMSTHDGKARIDASILRRMLAIIDSLPAAPQAEPKREPLTLTQIGTLSTQGLFSLMDQLDVAEAVRLVERAHGIGGSDE